MKKQLFVCINCPNAEYGETAEIHLFENGSITTFYHSPFGLVYHDSFQTLRGAKIYFSRYMKIKSEWKQELFPSQS